MLRLDSVLWVKGGLAGSKAVGGMRGGEEGERGRGEVGAEKEREGGGGVKRVEEVCGERGIRGRRRERKLVSPKAIGNER